MNTKDKIKNMRKQGLSYRKISKIIGLSYQRVHQIDKSVTKSSLFRLEYLFLKGYKYKAIDRKFNTYKETYNFAVYNSRGETNWRIVN